MKRPSCLFNLLPLACAFALSIPALAHICGPARIDLEVGKACLWRIYADRQETLSQYQPVLLGAPGVAEAYPKGNFAAHHGDFILTGQAPGTNFLQVQWSYQPTGAAGLCIVMIVVAPDDGTNDLQTAAASGVLVARNGAPSISSSDLFYQIDRYIPRQSPKLLIFAQCFGGNMALHTLFKNMPNTTILSATSPNQESHYGGYHDDAARGLKPETGRTAQTVHEEGSIGKSTLIPKDPSDTSPDPVDPTRDKTTFHQFAELPRVSGTVPPQQFSLEPVAADGAVRSRHVIVFAGLPDSRTEFVLRQGSFTIPASIGKKETFTDLEDRDQIRSNFQGQPNTTVTTVGGAPGAAGWDHPGDLEGLHKAIKKAGKDIEESADPSKEQFILFVTDHGEAGAQLYPNPRTLPQSANPRLRAADASRTNIVSNLQPFPAGDPILASMRRSPENQPKIELRIAPLDSSGAPWSLPPGAVALELRNEAGHSALLNDFQTAFTDLDGDGIIGSQPEEAMILTFPLDEQDLETRFLPNPFSVDLLDQSGRRFDLREAALLTGAISMGNSNPGAFISKVRVTIDGALEVVVNGLKQKRHVLQTSANLVDWKQAAEKVFADDTETFLIPIGATPAFFRISRP